MPLLKYDPSFGGHDAVIAQVLQPGEEVLSVTHGGYGPIGVMRPTDAKLYATPQRLLILRSLSTTQPASKNPDAVMSIDLAAIKRPVQVKGIITYRATLAGLEVFGPKKFIRLVESIANAGTA